MRKIILLLLVCLAGFANAQEITKTFAIKGQVEGDYKDYIYLRTSGKDNIKDSCLVVDNKFAFSGKLANAAQATLTLKPTSTIASFFIDNNPVEMTIAASSFLNGQEIINDIEIKNIKGSKVQELMTDVDVYQKTIEKSDLPKEEKNKKIYKKYYEIITGNQNYSVLDFVVLKSKKSGLLSADQITQLSSIVSNGKKMEVVKDTMTIKNKVLLSEKLAIGKKMEGFSLPNQNDKKVAINDFKGKFVLIDFWATWYKPTRVNNIELVKIYEKYKKLNLEIVSISIDTYAGNWKKAIIQDQMSWTNLIDVNGWQGKIVKQFGIKGIPLNILLDKEGTILAVNLTGDLLLEKLEHFLNVDSNK